MGRHMAGQGGIRGWLRTGMGWRRHTLLAFLSLSLFLYLPASFSARVSLLGLLDLSMSSYALSSSSPLSSLPSSSMSSSSSSSSCSSPRSIPPPPPPPSPSASSSQSALVVPWFFLGRNRRGEGPFAPPHDAASNARGPVTRRAPPPPRNPERAGWRSEISEGGNGKGK